RLIDRALAWDIDKRFPTARVRQSAILSAMRAASTAVRRPPSPSEDNEADASELTPVHEVVVREDPRVREIESMLVRWQEAVASGILHGFHAPASEGPLRAAFDACVEIHRR